MTRESYSSVLVFRPPSLLGLAENACQVNHSSLFCQTRDRNKLGWWWMLLEAFKPSLLFATVD
jgi:hypothetical protein